MNNQDKTNTQKQSPTICLSPGCDRETEKDGTYCCTMCEILHSVTDDVRGHWEYCNVQHEHHTLSMHAEKLSGRRQREEA